MAKKSFEKKAQEKLEVETTARTLYGIKRFQEGMKKNLDEMLYKELAEYWEKQADLYKLKFRVSFVFVILEALVIWILAYFL